MAKLTASQRRRMPASEFAGPDKSYPVNDLEHGRKALQLGQKSVNAGNLSPSTFSGIKAKVHRKFPSIGQRVMNMASKRRSQ